MGISNSRPILSPMLLSLSLLLLLFLLYVVVVCCSQPELAWFLYVVVVCGFWLVVAPNANSRGFCTKSLTTKSARHALTRCARRFCLSLISVPTMFSHCCCYHNVFALFSKFYHNVFTRTAQRPHKTK